jgi:hypothetical protein
VVDEAEPVREGRFPSTDGPDVVQGRAVNAGEGIAAVADDTHGQERPLLLRPDWFVRHGHEKKESEWQS